jgi:hypothetical protein
MDNDYTYVDLIGDGRWGNRDGKECCHQLAALLALTDADTDRN